MLKFISVFCLGSLISFSGFCQHALDVGDKMPGFTLKDQDGKTFNMKDSLGNNVFVIFFYPKDESPVCTKEACTFRDSMNLFKQADAQVIGINRGSVESHKKFQKDDNLNYELLSDPDEKVMKLFGIKDGLLTDRVTFVVDINGQIVYRYESSVDGKKHVSEALRMVKKLKNQQ